MQDAEHTLIHAGGEKLGFLVAGGGDQRHPDHHIGLRQRCRRSKPAAVQIDRLMQQTRREVRSEGIGQAALRRQLGGEQAGPEQPDRHLGAGARHRDDLLAGLRLTQQALQLRHFAGKVVLGLDPVAAQRAHGDAVGTRCAAKAEVDTIRIHLGQRAEGFRHHQRRMVGQHDSARADTHAAGAAGDVADQHGCRGTRDAWHVVVLRQPVAGKAECLDMLRRAQGNRQCVGDGASFADRNKVEHGQLGIAQSFHGTDYRRERPDLAHCAIFFQATPSISRADRERIRRLPETASARHSAATE